MTSVVNYCVNYVVQISISTGVYISVNYCSSQSCIPLETLCFGLWYVTQHEITNKKTRAIFQLLLLE